MKKIKRTGPLKKEIWLDDRTLGEWLLFYLELTNKEYDTLRRRVREESISLQEYIEITLDVLFCPSHNAIKMARAHFPEKSEAQLFLIIHEIYSMDFPDILSYQKERIRRSLKKKNTDKSKTSRK